MVKEGDRISFGPFDLEFVAVNHSIPDALAVAIRTGAGLVLHTGDFKMDQLPLDGRITDLRAFARLGEEGVDLFLTDSTNAETPGFTPAEKSITPVIDRVFHESKQRIIVACFASHVHRVQQVLDAAYAHERQVAYVGRSMVRNMAIARDLGYLKVPPGVLVDTKDLADLPPERQVLISTGSQGEPMSALSRIAQRNHNFVHIEEGDTVLLASSLIPGNENAVYRVINGLARWGANVVHKGNALVHVSGHASAGELLYCYNIVKPRNVLPVHGEIRHMRANADLARATGVENVVIAEDGVVVDLVDGVATISGKVDCGYVFVDGSSVGDITESDLKDRRILGEEGFISVIVVVDSVSGKVSGGPEIHARGFAEDDSTFDAIKPADRRGPRPSRLRGQHRRLPAPADRPPRRRPLGQQHPPPAADDHPGGHRGLIPRGGAGVRACARVGPRSPSCVRRRVPAGGHFAAMASPGLAWLAVSPASLSWVARRSGATPPFYARARAPMSAQRPCGRNAAAGDSDCLLVIWGRGWWLLQIVESVACLVRRRLHADAGAANVARI